MSQISWPHPAKQHKKNKKTISIWGLISLVYGLEKNRKGNWKQKGYQFYKGEFEWRREYFVLFVESNELGECYMKAQRRKWLYMGWACDFFCDSWAEDTPSSQRSRNQQEKYWGANKLRVIKGEGTPVTPPKNWPEKQGSNILRGENATVHGARQVRGLEHLSDCGGDMSAETAEAHQPGESASEALHSVCKQLMEE